MSQLLAGTGCSVDDCERPTVSRGWCHMHYVRWRRHGDPLHGPGQPCSVDDCDTPKFCRGLCSKHYQRLTHHGSEHYERPSTWDRFWAKVDIGDGCWHWAASVDGKGYGQFLYSPPGMSRAHRIAYEMLVGPIPDGLTIDHLCRNRRCVNPGHLEPVTMAENIRRAAAVRYA